MLASVLLAIDEVGLAVRLQSALEAAGHQVSWNAPKSGGLAQGSLQNDLIILLHRMDAPLGARVQEIKKADPPPAVLLLGSTPDAEEQARIQRVQFMQSGADSDEIVDAVKRSLENRYCNEITFETAMGALNLRAGDRSIDDHARILKGARQVDLNIVKQALSWHLSEYATFIGDLGPLRERRAIDPPEIEFASRINGTRTVRSLVSKANMPMPDAARCLWALISMGMVQVTPEPPARLSVECRAIYEARRHLAYRAGLNLATFYDVLEMAPTAFMAEADAAFHQLHARFSDEVLGQLDLGNLSQLMQPNWEQILEAHATVRDPRQRPYYNQTLVQRRDIPEMSWARTRNYQAAAASFAHGQQALVKGDVFAAVSSLASTARTHPGHPVYESSLCWARFRAESTRGGDRVQIATTELGLAEQSLLGRRAWPQGLVALGLLCVAAGDADSARWHLRLALKVEPRLPMAEQILSRL
jgi:hypothetical protein